MIGETKHFSCMDLKEPEDLARLKREISIIKKKSNKRFSPSVKKYFPELLEIFKTNNYTEIVFLIENDYISYPKCAICKTIPCSIRCTRGTRQPVEVLGYCKNKKCREQYRKESRYYENRTHKTQDRHFKKFGVVNPSQREEIKRKKVETTFKNYGVKNPSQTKVIKEKIKQTNLKRYGVNNPSQREEIKKKKTETTFRNYGVKHHSQSKELQTARIRKHRKKYGVDHSLQRDMVKQKIDKTNKERYGTVVPSQNVEIKKKISIGVKNTCEVKYDVSHPSYIFFNDEMKFLLKNTKVFKQELIGLSKFDFIKKYEISNSTYYVYLRDFGLETQCRSCLEQHVQMLLKKFDINFIANTREIIKPLELDIHIPEHKLAIEVCGLYWHSELYKKRKYHQKKHQLCKEQGIQLITIFEDEIVNKPHIVENRIKHLLKMNSSICYARQTQIKEITPIKAKNFLDEHHIQGNVPAKIKYGAYYKGNLVAVMTMGKKRRALGNKTTKEGEYELIRFATCGNVPGIASKIFKRFLKDYKPVSVLSFCDLRWGTGNLYKQLGFEFIEDTSPNYYYFGKELIRKHRFNYTKSKLVEKGGDPNMTEYENALDQGLNRIWDCGHGKWLLDYSDIKNEKQ